MFDNKRIPKFRFFQEFQSHLMLGMELCRGGSLKDLMRQRQMAN
jgi:serine/threonine protein kinase